ncbi:CehA/McbA family metallohydrolase [Actinocorallia longicatena]|uniref:CehA/McbA family metallohydrolase n=1 Tax=Actinocorallia longicatena TaxID=111803 RepID=A0ABP6QID9_9ACTN
MVRFTGRAEAGTEQWDLVRFEVPEGVSRITVSRAYERFSTPESPAPNVLDLGLIGPGGEFRGWSGGARDTFTVSASDATPGYLAGPIPPGTWAVALGPVVFAAAGMAWEILVELGTGPSGRPFESCPAPAEVPGRGPGWYRGDLHVHTVHSDGERTPGELAAAARARGLDFLGSSEHNTNAANRVWGASAPPGLLVLPGEEVTTRHGHWLAVGLPPDLCVDWRHRPGDGRFAALAGEVRMRGGAVVAAHPTLPVPGAAWRFGFGQVDAIEVWNGPWTVDDHFAVEVWDSLLRSGRRVTAIGNSDSHKRSDLVGLPQTAYHADALSARAVIAALKRGRCYLAESAAVSLTYRSVLPGDTLTAPAEVTAEIEGAPGTILTLHTARGTVAARHVPSSGRAAVTWRAADPAELFVRAEARLPEPAATTFSRLVALANPVWIS